MHYIYFEVETKICDDEGIRSFGAIVRTLDTTVH